MLAVVANGSGFGERIVARCLLVDEELTVCAGVIKRKVSKKNRRKCFKELLYFSLKWF